MPKYALIVIILVIVAAIGVFFLNQNKNSSDFSQTDENGNVIVLEGERENSNSREDNFSEENIFTIDEVSEHNSKDDCWLVVHGNVYDVTEFISNHPGGDAILQGCGKDATELFETRPMGSGTPHSQRARDLLKDYYIGYIGK